MTAGNPDDSCTYLRPELRGWGWDPWSSMTKLIGLTKSLGLVKHKQKAQLIFSNCSHTSLRVVKANLLLSSDANWQILKYGRNPYEVISFSVIWTVFSFFSTGNTRLTMNVVCFRRRCQLPSVFKKVKLVVDCSKKILFGWIIHNSAVNFRVLRL